MHLKTNLSFPRSTPAAVASDIQANSSGISPQPVGKYFDANLQGAGSQGPWETPAQLDILSTSPKGAFQRLSGTSMATPAASSSFRLLAESSSETKALRDRETADQARDLAKELNVSLGEAVDTYLFADAEAFELGMSRTEVQLQRGQKRQEMVDLLALHQPEKQRDVANRPIALLS